MRLMRMLVRLSIYMRYHDYSQPTISQSNVAWHLDHTLKVINHIYQALAQSDPADYEPDENKVRDYVLLKKKIKRGVAEAPAHVLPPARITPEALVQQLKEAKKHVTLLTALPVNSFFVHHSLGSMPREEAIKFIKIHTKHHLKIIEDIVSYA